MTSPQAKPSRDWLAHVQTARARHKIRQWIRQEEHEKSLELGREILAREVRRRRLAAPDAQRLERAAATLSVGTAEQLQAALGAGDLALGTLMRALYPDLPVDDLQAPRPTAFGRLAVSGEDRRGLYADICTAISESGTNIRSAEISTRDGAVFGSVLVEVENQTHLSKVIRAIRRVKGVMEVSRRESGPQTQPVVG